MAGFRATGNNGSFTDTFIQPGDILLQGEAVTSISGTAGTTLPATSLFTGLVNRSGPTAAFTDTIDTANNILTGLSGGDNVNTPVLVPGSTFRVRVINTTSYTETLAAGAGITLATGVFTLSADTFRDLLFTVVNNTQQQSVVGTLSSGSTLTTFALPGSSTSLPVGPSPFGLDITPGCSVSGTGIQSGTTVTALNMAQGGIIGCSLSATATASGLSGLTFGGTIKVDSIGSGNL